MTAAPSVPVPPRAAMPSRSPGFAAAVPDAPGDGSPSDSLAVGRADFFHCLAAAFRPPPAALTAAQWCEALASDLDDLAPAIGTPAGAAAARLRQYARAAHGGEAWLVEYSRLFLVPPVRVTLNAGIYLEGALGGAAAQMIAQCYARGGLAQCADFRDLPDHVALQLEFIGALLERAATGAAADLTLADQFVDHFVSGWAAPLRDACARARASGIAAAEPFAALAQLLVDVLDLEPQAAPRR